MPVKRVFPEIALLFVFIIGLFGETAFAGYRPELSGDLEIGDRYYTEITLEEFTPDEEDYISSEDLLDYYYYTKFWLRYRQQLSRDDYYYIKGQYYEKEYENKTGYNNQSIDLWGNYTYRLTEKARNRWEVNLRNKEYYNNESSSYNLLRIKYQFFYKHDDQQTYTAYYQRQWQDYIIKTLKDNICDRVSLSLDYKLNQRCDLNSSIQFDRELFEKGSASSNKYGKKFKIGFKLKL